MRVAGATPARGRIFTQLLPRLPDDPEMAYRHAEPRAARGVAGVSMNDKYDGTRMIHGECRLEATSPWADDVVLGGLRLHLDLHIVPRGSESTSGRGASAALRRASARVRALCVGVSMRRERALAVGIAVLAIAFVLWSAHEPSSSRGPNTEPSAAPSVAKAPEPIPLPVPAARSSLAPPPASVAPIAPELIVPPHAGPPSAALPRSRARDEKAVARRTAATPTPLADSPPRAIKSFAQPPLAGATSDREGAASGALPSPPSPKATRDMLDLFGDTK